MPFRLEPGRKKIQFLTCSSMPMNIFDARQKRGITSQTRYIQLAVCRQLSEDLGLDYDELVRELPEWKRHPRFDGTRLETVIEAREA